MALKATIIKAGLQIADMNRQYYQDHQLTLAQHPSETEERVMIRLLAFALHADDDLAFTKGISTEDEPDLWQKDLTGHIQLWIDLGQIEEKRIKKACGKSDKAVIYTYQPRNSGPWWQQIKDKLNRFDNLEVYAIETTTPAAFDSLFHRTMQLQCNIQDNTIYLSSDDNSLELNLIKLK
ncbi:MAG TPA: YaeQ family protein [Gammaproteobacteria bacterium]